MQQNPDSNTQILHLQQLRAEYVRRLRVREVQLARYGPTADPIIQIEIDDLRTKIADIDRQLGVEPAPPPVAPPVEPPARAVQPGPPGQMPRAVLGAPPAGGLVARFRDPTLAWRRIWASVVLGGPLTLLLLSVLLPALVSSGGASGTAPASLGEAIGQAIGGAILAVFVAILVGLVSFAPLYALTSGSMAALLAPTRRWAHSWRAGCLGGLVALVLLVLLIIISSLSNGS